MRCLRPRGLAERRCSRPRAQVSAADRDGAHRGVAFSIEIGESLGGASREIRHISGSDRRCIGQRHGSGVLVYAVDPVFVVKMRACCGAGAAYVADCRALLHSLAVAQTAGEARHVRIERADPAAVLEYDDAAVAALDAYESHPAVARRLDHGAGGRGVIHAPVRPYGVENRVASPWVEVRAYAREVERCAEKLSAHASAVGSEVIGDLAVL